VWDFGGMKRAKHNIDHRTPKDYFTWLLDHTTVIAEDDPSLEFFKVMDTKGLIQLRVIPATGCERFAEFLYSKINEFLVVETEGRVKVVKVEVYEHEKNSASYEE
jgi:6-pyruvoyltetrahydropterin/6-carboxytetrahydropterin synthase